MMNAPFGKPSVQRLALASTVLVLAGCSSLPSKQHAPDEEPVVMGSAPRRNHTPNEAAFACMASGIKHKNKPLIGIAVGDVKDYTGRYSSTEGSTITQGGALMVYSALGKLGGTVLIQERFDTRIAELELAYTEKRQLGDGRNHTVEVGKPAVPWVPYFGGSIIKSNYYIVGGITELNYNIASSGFEVAVNSAGIKRRTYTMNIGVDLRIVDTRSLLVAKTVSLQKQIIGQEVGAGVYRFFGSDLVDINVGNKNQEPLQMGVRTTIEQGVMELLAAITEVDPNECLNPVAVVTEPVAIVAAPEAKPNGNGAVTSLATPLVVSDVPQSILVPQNSGQASANAVQQLMFEFGSSAISGAAMSAVEKIVNDVAQGPPVTFQLVARDTELWPPLQRRELTNQRVKVAMDALAAKGIAASRIGVTWMPEPTDTSITRLGAGYQLVATLVVGK